MISSVGISGVNFRGQVLKSNIFGGEFRYSEPAPPATGILACCGAMVSGAYWELVFAQEPCSCGME